MLRARLAEKYSFDNIIGNAAPMQEVFKTVSQVAPSRASVLITGESGTGKELIAAAIHERSPRAKGPFVKLHCAALAESLLESELFGHERGSFTGALARRDGRFSQANGGTLFLDEIGEISPAVQVKLLRFLQEREFERVGGNETITRRRAGDRGDQPRSQADGRGGEVPRGSLLPPQRHQPRDAAAARASVGRPAAGLALPAQVRRGERQGDARVHGGRARVPDRLCLARQRARAGERHRARRRAGAVARRSPWRTCRPSSHPAKLRPGLQIPGATMDEIERYAITKTLESTGGSTGEAAEILKISVRKIQYKLHEYESAPKSARSAVRDREPGMKILSGLARDPATAAVRICRGRRVTSVLVGVDGSDGARRAAEFGRNVARAFKAQLTFLHVIEKLPPARWRSPRRPSASGTKSRCGAPRSSSPVFRTSLKLRTSSRRSRWGTPWTSSAARRRSGTST